MRCYTYMVRDPFRLVKASLFCAVTFAFAIGGAGCLADTGTDLAVDPDAEPTAGEDELRGQLIRLVGTRDLVAKDSPVLKAGAEGSLACGERFVQGGRERVTCTRGTELLEVILHKEENKAVVVHRASGRSSGAAFFVCTTSGNGPGDLPARLACAKKEPTSASGQGGLASPFAPTAPGIRINNTHAVGSGGLLLRGMVPRMAEGFDDLIAAGVGAVLIFKNQTRLDDPGVELAELTSRGLPASRVANIPFKWKDIGPFAEPCKQTIDALKFIADNASEGRKTFIHCTVGEDRTGLLAATQRLLREPTLTADKAWDEEMCERGYGSGNPLKPSFVTGQLARGLTPLYRKLAFLVATGRITAASLDPAACEVDPEADATFAATAIPRERLECGTSTRFEP